MCIGRWLAGSRLSRPLLCALLSWMCPVSVFAQTQLFNYSESLFGDPPSLYLWVVAVDSSSGLADLNGVELAPTTGPFTWNWGDGSSLDGYFPQSHTYADKTENYVVSVVSHYVAGGEDTARTLVRFVPANYEPGVIPADVPVTIPSSMPTLGTRLYEVNPNLCPFDDSCFVAIPRNSLENILTLVAGIELDFTNYDAYMYEGQFAQVMLRDPTFGGAYSIWFSDPVAFGVGDAFLQGSIGYTSLFHEMGHNLSLNTPAGFYFGGRIDGYANAIYSETMAQIYQHAAGWVLLNSTTLHDIEVALAFEIGESVTGSMGVIRNWYEYYLDNGMPYKSWNDPPSDATMATFMTLAYKFCEHAETSGMGYRAPLKRMMYLLQLFNQDLMDGFDQGHNTPAADSARATLMVAGMSHGFLLDLRDEYRDLNFPVDDSLFVALLSESGVTNTVPALQRLLPDTSVVEVSEEYWVNLEDPSIYIDPDGEPLSYTAYTTPGGVASAWVEVTMLHVVATTDGTTKVVVTASDPQGAQDSTAFRITFGEPGACACDCHADPRCDGLTDIFDVTLAVNRAFRNGDAVPDPSPTCPVETIDTNCDGVTDIFDVTHLVNVAFRNGDPAIEFSDPCP